MTMQPYEPRPIRFCGVREHAGWRVKLYSIALANATVDWPSFGDGITRALHALPQPARTPIRPGAAFLIAHQGRNIDYAVLGWWDRENELPLRVFVSSRAEDSVWRDARGSESVCVWDLQVVWFEREAYVSTILAHGDRAALDAYLALTLEPSARAQ